MAENSFVLVADALHSPKLVDTADLVIDDDIDRVAITIDRDSWTVSNIDTLIEWQMWRSEDDGVTWLDAGSSATHGGEITSDTVAVKYTVSKWSMSWPPGKKRKVKLRINIKREARTKIDLDTIIETK